MSQGPAWPAASLILAARLRLEPLRVEHAREAFTIFDDARLHTWIGGSPLSLRELEAQYRRQSIGQTPDGAQGWLNWMLRRISDDQIVGTVQATLSRDSAGRRLEAEVAWQVGTDFQSNGYGREGALAMARWLGTHGVEGLVAHIHPGHDASIGIARVLGLTATDTVRDGEVLWVGRGAASR